MKNLKIKGTKHIIIKNGVTKLYIYTPLNNLQFTMKERSLLILLNINFNHCYFNSQSLKTLLYKIDILFHPGTTLDTLDKW
jgi:hypothetical protein